MPRPRKQRVIQKNPASNMYKPCGIPKKNLKTVNVPVEGLEALRLADAENMDHVEAAKLMEVSRPTFSRILTAARASVAKALVNGWVLEIQGGNFIHMEDRQMCRNRQRKNGCSNNSQGRGQGLGRGLGRMNANVAFNNSTKLQGNKIMSKIAISCIGNDLNAKVDGRFGRANDFLIVDIDTMEFEHIDNSSVNEMGSGAGIQTAQAIAKSGAEIVLTGSVGPKAANALGAAGVDYVEGFSGITVKEAIEQYKTAK